MKITLLFIISAIFTACFREESPVVLNDVKYEGAAPISVNVDSTKLFGPGFVRQIDFRYLTKYKDTLDVFVIEFKSDVYALDYYRNSGRFQGIHPILRGDFIEQSIRSDARIFIFHHDSFRRYDRSALETYVRGFPGYRGGFPQEFLSLPFEHREPGSTSIQTQSFLGSRSCFPVLIQSYSDGNLRWNVARSWSEVEESDFSSWSSHLIHKMPKGIVPSSDNIYFESGDGGRGIATLLPGGRVVVVWGYMDWYDLERKFFIASDRIYEARY